MTTFFRRCSLVGLAGPLIALLAGRADAQSIAAPIMPASLEPYLHGVPAGTASTTALPLSLADAVKRGLDHNLGPLLEQDRIENASGERWKALSEALPHIGASISQTRQEVDLAAFGFTGFPGIQLPTVVGPFSVFDARIAASAPIIDLQAFGDVRKQRANERAEQHTFQDTRELVILAVANLYMQTLADKSRVDALHAQAETANALFVLAQDQRTAGVVAGIDVLRQQVQLQSARQRVISAENELEKQKLRLARAIGLPIGQQIELTDPMTYAAAPPITLDAAVAQAYAQREDLKSAEERINAAAADRDAAHGGLLPTLRFDANYGAIGPSLSSAQSTFAAALTLRVPVFEGGEAHGKVLEADADLHSRQAQRDDLKAGIAYDLQSALLDLRSAEAAVDVAKTASSLADQQLTQARDRFAAGVSNSIELAQAQDAVASASDNYIISLYAHLLAKAALARALGVSESGFVLYLGGKS